MSPVPAKPSFLWAMISRFNAVVRGARGGTFKGSERYWNDRYDHLGNSGSGSYGRLAEFKAEVLNQFVSEQQVRTVIEFGCGDGNQLSLARYPRYIGLDVARGAIRRCQTRFVDDRTKSFFLLDQDCFTDNAGVFKSELALSLDVVFHLVEDSVFERYMQLLFASASRFVIVYSSNFDMAGPSPHERQREFTRYVSANLPDWKLIRSIKNPYPAQDFPEAEGSLADFFFFQRTLAPCE